MVTIRAVFQPRVEKCARQQLAFNLCFLVVCVLIGASGLYASRRSIAHIDMGGKLATGPSTTNRGNAGVGTTRIMRVSLFCASLISLVFYMYRCSQERLARAHDSTTAMKQGAGCRLVSLSTPGERFDHSPKGEVAEMEGVDLEAETSVEGMVSVHRSVKFSFSL